jgi:hypothetical protein
MVSRIFIASQVIKPTRFEAQGLHSSGVSGKQIVRLILSWSLEYKNINAILAMIKSDTNNHRIVETSYEL